MAAAIKTYHFHARPCATCGHDTRHSEIAGCTQDLEFGKWCDCPAYVDPAPRNRTADAAQGRALAEAGVEAAQSSYAMTVTQDGREWTANAQARIQELIDSGAEFTAEDVTDTVGVAPSPSAIGGLFRAKAFKAQVDLVRIDTATRKVAHGRPLRVWKRKAADG